VLDIGSRICGRDEETLLSEPKPCVTEKDREKFILGEVNSLDIV